MKTAAAAAVQQAYLDAFFELEGDLPGREAAQNYLNWLHRLLSMTG